MKKYRFRLETVLRLRRAELEQARMALAAANLRSAALLLVRDNELAHYQELAMIEEGTDVEALLVERQDAGLAASRLEYAEQAVTQATADAAVAQLDWLAASRRVKALERLEERSRFEYEEEVRHGEIALVDDLVNARFARTGGRDTVAGR